MNEFYSPYRYRRYVDVMGEKPRFREIEKCLVRKDHPCGKFLGASKSCFIACPSTDEVETILALISEKLTKIGIEPVIAIKERAYGQDIFCTKICGKIVESQFCIVILDDTVKVVSGENVNIPNPNVYYEYGLMTALGKRVIPLQKSGQALAFNIQTHDTIKYTPRDLSFESDRALKDATKITLEDRSGKELGIEAVERLVDRCLQINGYTKTESDWFLEDDYEDTPFSAYHDPKGQGCLLLTVGRDKESLNEVLTDMQVIIKRLETRHSQLLEKKETLDIELERASKKEPPATELGKRIISGRLPTISDRMSRERVEVQRRLDTIENTKFAIVLMPEIAGLQPKVIEQYENMDKGALNLPLYIGDNLHIQIGDGGLVNRCVNVRQRQVPLPV